MNKKANIRDLEGGATFSIGYNVFTLNFQMNLPNLLLRLIEKKVSMQLNL